MIDKKRHTKLSKFLSLVLRHQPETIGIELDKNGWTDVNTLIKKMALHKRSIDLDTLRFIVKTNNKKRFAFNEKQDKIRANQGHSIKIELGYKSQKPPEILFHGTAQHFVDSIFKTGLEKRNRHHVHLSSDTETAVKVGQRHGKPIVLKVLAEQMYKNGFEFFISENGVWLTNEVPVKYLSK